MDVFETPLISFGFRYHTCVYININCPNVFL